MQYKPDGFVILKIETKSHGSFYKIFASWAGGYTTGDNWKLSSGFTDDLSNITKDSDGCFIIPQYSGSEYIVSYANENRLTSYNQSKIDFMIERANESDEVIEFKIVPLSTILDDGLN